MSQHRKQGHQLGESTVPQEEGRAPRSHHTSSPWTLSPSPQKRQVEHSFSHLIASYQAGISILMNYDLYKDRKAHGKRH